MESREQELRRLFSVWMDKEDEYRRAIQAYVPGGRVMHDIETEVKALKDLRRQADEARDSYLDAW